MSNERPDEFLVWRWRIGQSDALPEQGLDDREVTWQRLNARLGSVLDGERQPGNSVRPGENVLDGEGDAGRHTRRRRIHRYGIAAAFLLLALIPATRLFRCRPLAEGPAPVAIRLQAGTDGEVDLVTRSNPATAEKVSLLDPSVPVAPLFVTAPKEKIPGRRVGQRPPERSGDPSGRLFRANGQGRLRPVVGLYVVAERQGPVDVGAPADPGIRLAVVPPPERKPLRVVSINEIDIPVTTGPAITFHRLPAPFRVSLNPRASALRMATAVDEKEPPFLKIKLNP